VDQESVDDMRKRPVVLYHRTDSESARSIMAGGFKDSTGKYGMNIELTGVWLSNVPLDENEGASGDTLLRVAITMDQKNLDYYEVQEEGKPYREWCLPARVVNPHMKITIAPEPRNLWRP
jgi:hypothetical protein